MTDFLATRFRSADSRGELNRANQQPRPGRFPVVSRSGRRPGISFVQPLGRSRTGGLGG